jgi:pentatricopeptide repeat domain-containing protein 1
MKSGDLKAVNELFAKMKSLGFVDVISFNTLLKGARATGPLDAMSILEDMRSRNLQPNQVTYNSLINACVSKGDMKTAWSFVEEMQQLSVEIDNFTCSIMMKGLKFSSSKDDVDKTLNLIERSRVRPDEVLVNTLLDACIRLRDVKRLTSALNTFRLSGVVPSEHAYGTLIRAYGQARCLPQAQSMWTDMLERKVRPSEATFTSMVEACVNNGAFEEALTTLREMKAAIPSFATPAQTYALLIKGFAQRKDTTRVMEVYRSMQESRVLLDLVTFNCLINACARVGDMEQASQFFREMKAPPKQEQPIPGHAGSQPRTSRVHSKPLPSSDRRLKALAISPRTWTPSPHQMFHNYFGSMYSLTRQNRWYIPFCNP